MTVTVAATGSRTSTSTSTTLLAAVAVAAATGASILTSLVVRYVDRRWRWRDKCRRFRRAASAAETDSTQLPLMLAGEPYDCDERSLADLRAAAHALAAEYNRPERTVGERAAILRVLLASPTGAGPGPCIEPPFRVDYGRHLRVGRRFFANFGCTMLDCARIDVGDNVFLGPGVQIYTAAHPLDAAARRRTEFARPVSIGDDVWIGGAAIVLPGVRIGNRVVVAAGAVVAKDVADDVVVAGVPARVVKNLR